MFQILRSDAVALCEGYGFLMAGSWNPDRLTKKTAEMRKLIRTGEYDGFGSLAAPLQEVGAALSEAEDFKIVQKMKEKKEVVVSEEVDEEEMEPTAEDYKDAVQEEDEEEEEEDEDDEDEDEEDDGTIVIGGKEDENEEEEDETKAIVVECVLKVGQRVLVNEEESWKGTISEILDSDYIEVEDRKGEVWEVAVEKCEVLQQKRKVLDPQEEELLRLEALVRKAKRENKGKTGTKGSKKVTRNESIFRILESMDSPLALKEIAERSNKLYVENGGTDKVTHAESSLRLFVQLLIRFGVFRMAKGKIEKV